MAALSRSFRDFIYDHHELWPNLTAKTDSSGDKNAIFQQTLMWAFKRHKIRRLQAIIKNDSTSNSSPLPPSLQQDVLSSCLNSLSHSLIPMSNLISLTITIDIPSSAHGTRSCNQLATLIRSVPTTLKQLCISGCNLQFPSEGARLTALTSLVLYGSRSSHTLPSSPSTADLLAIQDGNETPLSIPVRGAPSLPRGVIFQPNSLPASGSLKHLHIGHLGTPSLPDSLTALRGIKSLSIDWAADDIEATVPDFSLLEQCSSPETAGDGKDAWSSSLTHLSLGYYQATTLPERLPPTLKSLSLQWNIRTSEDMCRKADNEGVAFDVDAFHRSFKCLESLTMLTHLNLNNALGGWGLPSSVQKLTQLQSLGVVGSNPFYHWNGRKESIPLQLQAFKQLRSLDVEVYEASSHWECLAQLTNLERLRLGRGESPEAYVAPSVKNTIGTGLVRLLPALPKLKEVCTEGMMLPATASCGQWNRLMGSGVPPGMQEDAARAVKELGERGVALQRWYAWPFMMPGTTAIGNAEGVRAWNEVE